MNETSIPSVPAADASTAVPMPAVLRQQTLFPEHDPRWLALINRVIEAELGEADPPANGSLFQGELFEGANP